MKNFKSFQELNKYNKEELIDYIKNIKQKLSKNIVIAAHHYQNPDIIQFADFVGDSYKLAIEANNADTDFIVFCGVLFMAEGARILANKNQKIIIPNPHAGCPLADMADLNMVKKAFNKIQNEINKNIAPVVYINSYADLKSFCGEKDGSVCTSSNAGKIINFYLNQDKSILFFPDYYLGKNTANQSGIKEENITVIKKNLSLETTGNIKESKVFLWDGFCPVHHNFIKSDIINLRKNYPMIKIIVHPECREDIVNESDIVGSTEKIFNTIKNSEKGSIWGVGTETTFVERIAVENRDKTILPLKTSACKNMVMTTLPYLASSLQSILYFKENKNKTLRYEVNVDKAYQDYAKKSLNKMIDIVENQ
jgi:quinolinate synthase